MFQVVWLQTALNELASVWMQAGSTQRMAITEAAQQLTNSFSRIRRTKVNHERMVNESCFSLLLP